MVIFDENGNIVNTELFEKNEQLLAEMYINTDDFVLELGGRYGSVACVIDKKLENKPNLVTVEPDQRVWDALERNKKENNCQFNIVKGFISNKKLSLRNLEYGYGTSSVEDSNSNIPSFTLNEIEQKFNIKFNVLFADCEGFLETFLNENPLLLVQLRLIIFEQDEPTKCNYNKIKNNLKKKSFKQLVDGFHTVWIKDNTILVNKNKKTLKNKKPNKKNKNIKNIKKSNKKNKRKH